MPQEQLEPVSLVVADGEVLVRNALAEYLRGCGYKVIDAASTDEVLSILSNSSAVITAIMADAELGGTLNAFELRLRVRQEYPGISVVLAGNVDAAAKAAGDLCDEGPHLKRPYDPEAVALHIKRLLETARRD